jgi:hypothetical protein
MYWQKEEDSRGRPASCAAQTSVVSDTKLASVSAGEWTFATSSRVYSFVSFVAMVDVWMCEGEGREEDVRTESFSARVELFAGHARFHMLPAQHIPTQPAPNFGLRPGSRRPA